MHQAISIAQLNFRAVLERFGEQAPALRRIDIAFIAVPPDDRPSWRGGRCRRETSVAVTAHFANDYHVRWTMRDYVFETAPDELRSDPEDYYRRLYARLFEDFMLERQIARRREQIYELERMGVSPYMIGEAVRALEREARHVRRYHSDRVGRAIEQTLLTGTFDGADAGTASAAAESAAITAENLRRQMSALLRVPHQALMSDFQEAFLQAYRESLVESPNPFLNGNVGSSEAQERGRALLLEWLTPEQRAQYEQHDWFEVRGSDTGRRYRIRHGRQMNIDELDEHGEKIRGWCFLPEGQLVAGDVMLAQKISLETQEREALKVANLVDGEPDDFVRAVKGVRARRGNRMTAAEIVQRAQQTTGGRQQGRSAMLDVVQEAATRLAAFGSVLVDPGA